MDRHQHAIVRDAKCRKSGSHSDHGWVCQKLRQPTGEWGTNFRSEECDALFYVETSAGNQPAGQAVCGVRPLVRFRSVSDVAEPLVCPCRNRRRPRKQQADTSTRHDIAQAHTLLKLFLLSDHFHFYRQFQADCQSSQLPSYSLIEPQYYPDMAHPENDQHPPSVVTLGEQLIADVYNRLRSSKLWIKTLLIITYDEHGGCHDHVPPPSATQPETPRPDQVFKFDRFGVRVPAVIVSPYVKPGTILRPPGAVPYDHTSIIATLRKRFPALGGPQIGRAQV